LILYPGPETLTIRCSAKCLCAILCTPWKESCQRGHGRSSLWVGVG